MIERRNFERRNRLQMTRRKKIVRANCHPEKEMLHIDTSFSVSSVDRNK